MSLISERLKSVSFFRLSLTMLLVALLVLSACRGNDEKEESNVYQIGVLNESALFDEVLEGFKAGLAERGYVEGENVLFTYSGATGSLEALEPTAEELKALDLDLLLTFGTPATSVAKDVFAETDVPIVFAPVTDPVGSGIVGDLRDHEENITGVKPDPSVDKALEWLVESIPGLEKVYVPHIPSQSSSVSSVEILTNAASQLGIELIVVELNTPDEILAAPANVPEDADAVYLVRAGDVMELSVEYIAAAMDHNIPVALPEVGNIVNEQGAMVGYGATFFDFGQQAARLGDQVLKGTEASDLPVETADAYLAINLATAEALGIEIPDTVLRQAKVVIRPESAD